MELEELSGEYNGKSHRDCDLLGINGPLSKLELKYQKDSDGSQWKVAFSDVYACRIVSEEFVSNHLLSITSKSSSFYTTSSSEWITELKEDSSRGIDDAKHFILFFYDEVIEIIAAALTPEQQG